MVRVIYLICRKIARIVIWILCSIYTKFLLWVNNVKVGDNFKSNGCPKIDIWEGGEFTIGKDFKMNNGKHYNNIGRQQACSFVVMSGAVLNVGNNVGMSASAIVCKNRIIIEDYVKLGGNVVIYDTDFHSLDPEVRKDRDKDLQNANDAPVIICENAFIGAHSTILKGVTIGKNSIVGACSVVTKSVPPNQVWAGNPARFIREI